MHVLFPCGGVAKYEFMIGVLFFVFQEIHAAVR